MDRSTNAVSAGIVAMIAAICVGMPQSCLAQRAILGGANTLPTKATTGEFLVENVFLRAERVTLQRLSDARHLCEQGRHGEAIRHLGAILDLAEDFFLQPDTESSSGIHRSVKHEALRLIGEMPAEGRRLYELQYGSRARRMLAEAVTTGNVDLLKEVSRRFFHTSSGHEATLLLGLDHLDHGRALDGAITLERIHKSGPRTEDLEPTLSLAIAVCWYQAGLAEKAAEVLQALGERNAGNQSPETALDIAGQREPLARILEDVDQWLAQRFGPVSSSGVGTGEEWPLLRGDYSRNAASEGGRPLLNRRWRVAVANHPMVEDLLHGSLETNTERGVPTLTAFHPLAVDDVVLMRTSQNLTAVDFRTGKRLWEVPVDDPLEALAESGTAARSSLQILPGFERRIRDDATFGTTSSDGNLVFSIENLSIGGVLPGRQVSRDGRANELSASGDCNRLAAHDIKTGKLVWELGGPPGKYELPQSGTFFLGAPLPLSGSLYVIAETQGEIRLMVLDATHGSLLWSQQLAVIERGIEDAPVRRLAGVSPSYGEGVLVCPTAAGAVVGIELSTRVLLWGFRYGCRPDMLVGRRGFFPAAAPFASRNQEGRWIDAITVVADGRVLITPIESDFLYCLDLHSGESVWHQPVARNEGIYLACVYDGLAVTVGRDHVAAYRLADGKPAWNGKKVVLPGGAMPSGRGFLSEGRYYVPLGSAQVASIDLADGRIASVSRSLEGIIPGNLICHKNYVLSQGPLGLDSFHQLIPARAQVERRLAESPNDADALVLFGEICLDQQKPGQAVDSLERAYALAPRPRTRYLLRAAYLDGLERDFDSHRELTERIEPLLDNDSQRATYLRLMATGLRASGEWQPSLNSYLDLITLNEEKGDVVQLDSRWIVRRDRWLRRQLAELREEAAKDTTGKAAEASLDAAIGARLETVLSTASADELQESLAYFTGQPAASVAEDTLLARLHEAGRFLDVERILVKRQHNADEKIAAGATAQMASMLALAGHNVDAAVCYRRLASDYANVECSGVGQHDQETSPTGKAVVGGLDDDNPIRSLITGSVPWPTGKVETETERTSAPPDYLRHQLRHLGPRGPFFSDRVIRFDQNRQRLTLVDTLGNRIWQLPLVEAGSRTRFSFNVHLSHVRSHGHLLMASIGSKIVGIDTLGTATSEEQKDSTESTTREAPDSQDSLAAVRPRVLWILDVNDIDFASERLKKENTRAGQLRGGLAVPRFSAFYSPNGLLGPVTHEYACFQRHRKVYAIDSMTGELLWVRGGMESDSTLFGDDEHLFVLAPNRRDLTVLRPLDGMVLGTRKIPASVSALSPATFAKLQYLAPLGLEEQRYATIGRRILLWREQGEEQILQYHDPWHEKDAWPARRFSLSAKCCLLGDEAVGVMEPDGHFLLLSLQDGRPLVDTRLQEEKSMNWEIVVFRSADQYVLVTRTIPEQLGAGMTFSPLHATSCKAIHKGRVYAFDREGKTLWPDHITIDNQVLLLNQPSDIPVIVFARQSYKPSSPASERYEIDMLCLDARTGKSVYEATQRLSAKSTFEMIAEPVQVLSSTNAPGSRTVTLRLRQRDISLAFTNEME